MSDDAQPEGGRLITVPGILEKPLQYRRMQLQLMTPEQFKGHLCMLDSNIKTVPKAGLGPICPNFVTAMEEAEAQLLRTGSHLDPEAMEALRTQVKLELPETEARAVVEAQEERDEAHYERTGEHLPAAHFTGVGNAVSEVHKESRLVESLVEAAYFAQVGAQHPELAAVAQNAVEQSAKDRQRWMDTAIREALARLAPKKPKGE